MAKKKTPFGNIMNLLDISLIELSEYLHIDRTTISKWRTGGRKLLPSSPYFDPILSFFMNKNNKNVKKPLINFLCEMYPDVVFDSAEQVYGHLKRYLSFSSDETDDFMIKNLEIEPIQSLFVGVEERKKAFNYLLDEAEKMISFGTIKILELDENPWLCRDAVYLQKTIARIVQLANKNFKIEFAFSSFQTHPTFISSITAMAEIRFHKNISKYIIDTGRIHGLIPCIYVSDMCVAVGMDGTDLSVPIHTNLFLDSFNVDKYSKLFDLVIKLYGNKVLVTDNGAEVDRILKTVDYLRRKREDLFYFGDFLSITTMSQSLFLEILTENNILGNERERCLSYYKSLRHMMETSTFTYTGAYYMHLDILENALSYEYLLEHELSALTNRQIRKTPTQYRRHLLETVEFLEKYEKIQLVLLSGPNESGYSCLWVKKNLWSLSFNTVCVPNEYQVVFWDDYNMINFAMQITNFFAEKNYATSHRQRAYNLKILRELGNNPIQI